MSKQKSSVCDRKRPFGSFTKADAVAAKTTIKTKEWIIPYRCFECGEWHIGHDKSYNEKYGPVQYWLCEHCGRLVPEIRRIHLMATAVKAIACSKRCNRYLQNKRNRSRRRLELASDPRNAEKIIQERN